MSIEQAQAFFEKVKNDEDLQKRLSEAQDNESKLEIARQEGFEFDLEEAKKAKDALTEEALARVAAGSCSLEPSNDSYCTVHECDPKAPVWKGDYAHTE